MVYELVCILASRVRAYARSMHIRSLCIVHTMMYVCIIYYASVVLLLLCSLRARIKKVYMIARCRPLCIILYIYIYIHNIMHTTVQRSYSVVAKYSTREYELV